LRWMIALCLSLALAAAAPVATASELVVDGVTLPVQAAASDSTPTKDRIYCEGRAPTQAQCAGSMVLTGNFDIVVGVEYWYFGWVTVRGATPTGSVTIRCEQTFSALACSWRHDGVFVEGQTFTLTGVASGMSRSVPGTAYWRIRVP
jgi:hypothetical protein